MKRLDPWALVFWCATAVCVTAGFIWGIGGCAPPGSRQHPLYGHATPFVGMCPKQTQCPKQCPKEKKTLELETVPHVGP